jgi:hypothetical protein
MKTHRMPTVLILLTAVLLPAAIVSADNPEWIGYGGPEGSRVYPGENPPTKFDHTTGKGVKWETLLPVWGHGSPVFADGKLFLTCETGPKNIFPMLLCLDANTGEILWKREIDHLDAIPGDPVEHDKLRKRLRAYFDRESELIKACASAAIWECSPPRRTWLRPPGSPPKTTVPISTCFAMAWPCMTASFGCRLTGNVASTSAACVGKAWFPATQRRERSQASNS